MKTICFSGISMNHYRPQTKFAKVMFSQVSLCPQGGVCHTHPPDQRQTPPGQTPPGQAPLTSACWDTHPPTQCMLGYIPSCPVHSGIHPLPSACWETHPSLPSACWDTVNKRAVRIPLECILVQLNFDYSLNYIFK